jgi:hypothetical protein
MGSEKNAVIEGVKKITSAVAFSALPMVIFLFFFQPRQWLFQPCRWLFLSGRAKKPLPKLFFLFEFCIFVKRKIYKTMAYNKFKKLEQLQEKLGINEFMESWLSKNIVPYNSISIFLTEALMEAEKEALTTEKAKSESIVVPILKELKRRNADSFSYFSGFEFNVDKSQGLSGYCDFILSAETKKNEITSPIFCLIEAKDGEIDKSYAQCGAEMYAAQLFNERKGNPQKIIYGCVTNAFSWCFMKLEDKNLYIDTNYVPLTFAKPYEVLAVLQWILDASLAKK